MKTHISFFNSLVSFLVFVVVLTLSSQSFAVSTVHLTNGVLKWTLSSRQLFQILRYNPFVYF